MSLQISFEKISTLQSLKDTFSPVCFFHIYTASAPAVLVLLKPSLLEFASVIALDLIVAALVIRWESRPFLRLFPETALFFPRTEETAIAGLGAGAKIDLYQAMARYPLRRAAYVFVVDYVKFLPAWAVMIFLWDYPGGMLRQTLIAVLISTFLNIFAFQMVYVESQVFLSGLIARLHEKFNWRDVFLAAPVAGLKRHFETQEKFNLAMLFLVMLLLQGIVLATYSGQSPSYLLFQVLTIGLITLLLMARVWSLGRRYIFGGLAELFAAMDTLDYSNQNAVLPLHTAELLAKFERSFNGLVARLQQSERELVGWAHREAEKSAQLMEKQGQLRRLTAELAAVEARERRRIAEDLHDSVCQGLALCVAQLKNLQASPVGQCPPRKLDEIRTHLERTIAETRGLTYELSPPVLYDFGIEAALEWLVENLSARHPLNVRFETGGPPVALDDNLKAVLYRSARELLFNVIKHARAQNAVVSVSAPDSSIRIEVEDDGVGFDPDVVAARTASGFGLFSIRERLEPLGGSLELSSRPGGGTVAVMTLPLA